MRSQIPPGLLFPAFLLLGPVLALYSSLNSGMVSITAPVLGAIRNGWLPEAVGKTNRRGSPWIIYTVIWVICVVPLVLGVGLKTFAAYTVMTQRLSGMFLLISAFFFPKKFPEQWKASFLHMPDWLYYTLLTLSVIAELLTLAASVMAISLPVFIGNLALVGGLTLYAVFRYKSGETHTGILVEDAALN